MLSARLMVPNLSCISPQIAEALKELKGVRSAIESSLHPHKTPGSERSKSRNRSKSVPKVGLGFKFRRLKTGLFEVTEVKLGGGAALSGKVSIGDRYGHFLASGLCVTKKEAESACTLVRVDDLKWRGGVVMSAKGSLEAFVDHLCLCRS